MISKNSRVNSEKAFLLSSQPWRESSLLIHLYSQYYGRITLIARSARKRQSELRGVLMPFVPINTSWYGKQELKILHRAEWIGGWKQPQGQALFSALYINELTLKLTPLEDPDPKIYEALFQVMQHISTQNLWAHLRYFEWQLLKLLGFAPDITKDSQNIAIQSHQQYWVGIDHAPILLNNISVKQFEIGMVVQGETLIALDTQSLDKTSTYNQEALRLTRMLLDYRLPNGIQSRQILQQLQQLNQ